MKINVTFDSMEEFLKYVDVRGKVQTTFTDFSPREIEKIYEDRKKEGSASTDAEPTPAEEKPAEAEPASAPAEEKPQLDESIRVEARKVLADLNKRTGKNTAKEILSRMGFASLNKAPLDQIPAIIANAREEAADAE